MKKLISLLLVFACSTSIWAEQYPDKLWAVGNATSAGWLSGTDANLYKTSEKKYEGFVNFTGNGELKFLCQRGWSDMWGATGETTITGTGTYDLGYHEGGNPDTKFNSTITGIYLVTLDMTTEGSETATFKQWTDSDVYEIGTLGQLKAFADGVNNFDASIDAKLTADITDALDYAIGWYNSADDNKLYSGDFNGNGHTITLGINNESESNKGLFGAAKGGANIHDVIVTGSVTGQAKVGGIVGYAGGGGTITLTNVINTANIHSTGNQDANAAGLVGCILSSTNVNATNCANTGAVSGQNGQCAAFAGWTQSGTKFTNCWNIGEINNIESSAQLYRNSGQTTATNCYDLTNVGNQGTKLDASTLGSGELCYKLNGEQTSINWYQTIGTDDIPVPFSTGHLQVYANGEMRCDGTSVEGGTLTYSNESTSVIPDHEYENGFCKVCDKYQENAFTATEGWYEISQPWQLRWMAVSVNEHNSTYGNANIKLTADIDYTAYTNQAAMFGKPSNTFKGTFDGQYHTVTVAFNNTEGEESGLFRRINGGTVKNLKVAGTITTNQKLAGGICSGIWQKGTITNCESAVTIIDNGSGDATHGGILAAVHDKTNTGIHIYNCLFSGTLNAPNRTGSGGIVGWPDNASNQVMIYNCLVTGTITLADNNDNDVIVRNTADVQNCYYSCSLTNNLRNSKSATAVAEGEAASGALCYKLNENVSGGEGWFQTLGTDEHPIPFSTSAKLYANSTFECDGVTPKEGASITYSNTDEAIIDPHAFGTDGICIGCHAVGEEATDIDGTYQLTNAGKLLWWAQYVNAGHTEAKAVLTADVDLTAAKYTPAGNETHVYVGHFDGQGHTVTLALNNPDKDYQGLFGVVTDGVKIEKVIVKGSVTGKSFVGGIAGGTNGGSENEKTTDIWYCGNEATITATGPNGAGIIGVNMDGHASIILTNCYNTGNIASGNDGGALSGWLGGGWSSVTNCYNSGTVKNGENASRAFCRNSGCFFTNCYYTEGSGTDNTSENTNNGTPAKVTDTALASGELCYKLNDDQSEIAFYQTLGTDEHPVFNGSTVSYVGEVGYATLYDTTTGYELKGDVKAYVATLLNTWLELTEIDNVPASTPVILKGDYYNKIAADLAAINIANDLKGTDTDTEADGTMYVLAYDKQDGVGFYKAKNRSTIKAGKAYFQYTGTNEIKAFYFEFDNATGIAEIENGKLIIENSIYNVAGQKLAKMQKGINIVNGKKILK